MSVHTTSAFVAYADNLLHHAATHILAAHPAPDLNSAIILLPHLGAATPLKNHLLSLSSTPSLLGLHIHTPRSWAEQQPHTLSTLTGPARQLMLLDALRQHPDLMPGADPWRLAETLLALFDQLTLAQQPVNENFTDFLTTLAHGYGTYPTTPKPLSREAQLVHTLWHAWHQQHAQEHRAEATANYLTRLHQACQQLHPDQHLWLLGFDQLTPAECQCLKPLIQQQRASILLYGDAHGEPHQHSHNIHQLSHTLDLPTAPNNKTTAYEHTLNQIFTPLTTPLHQRAAANQQQHPNNPLAAHLTLLKTDDAETEAHAAALQIRLWLLAGKQRIGLITEDRQIARRIRALLERANIPLQDTGGWALSTTRAAALLDNWLNTLDTQFSHTPLSGTLHSPFLNPNLAPPELHRVLDEDIIPRAHPHTGLDHYRQSCDELAKKPPAHWAADTASQLHHFFDQLDHAAEPLLALKSNQTIPARRYFEALHTSLKNLGATDLLKTDAAGEPLLAHLDTLHRAAQQQPLKLTWAEFRRWLHNSLEAQDFNPHTQPSPVMLGNLAQAYLQSFDALVFVNTSRDFLPGTPSNHAIFNDSVRHELKLPSWRDEHHLKLHRFRRLLSAAPNILLTHRQLDNGQPVTVSPWLERISSFSQLAYGDDLYDAELAQLAQHPATQITNTATQPTAAIDTHPSIPKHLLPARISIAAHQRLIDCPYQFMLQDCLQLHSPKTLRDELNAADFGQRVHRGLQAFHSHLEHLPGPFGRQLDQQNRAQAQALLIDIGNAIFAKDLAANALHHAWQLQWQAIVPAYIEWEITHQQHGWRPIQHEQQHQQTLGTLELYGRLDRIDQQQSQHNQHAIIDYKTGRHSPKQDEVESGEDIQLISYALLIEHCSQVEYLQLHASEGIKTTAQLSDEHLHTLAQNVRTRLETTLHALQSGQTLPDHPDDCPYCQRSQLHGITRPTL